MTLSKPTFQKVNSGQISLQLDKKQFEDLSPDQVLIDPLPEDILEFDVYLTPIKLCLSIHFHIVNLNDNL